MIVITGPGRSGTSLLARLYQELGFDPGGRWVDEIEGGLEAPEIVTANDRITEALGLAPMGAPPGFKRRIRRLAKRLVPKSRQSATRTKLRWLPFMGSDQPQLLRWEAFADVVGEYGPDLCQLAGQRQVAKDPRFLWTLPVWIAAGAPIEHVLISIRHLDAVVSSRGRMDSLRFREPGGAKNSFVYGLGLTIWTLSDYNVAHAIVRFPDFLRNPAGLHGTARFPTPVTADELADALRRIARPELIHDPR